MTWEEVDRGGKRVTMICEEMSVTPGTILANTLDDAMSVENLSRLPAIYVASAQLRYKLSSSSRHIVPGFLNKRLLMRRPMSSASRKNSTLCLTLSTLLEE